MRELSERLQSILDSLPHKPGIYLHKDADGHVLYVGKATSLHSRVRSYFGDPGELSPKNRALVAKIADIDYIVVGSEIEALILENEYIKQYQPKYNVRLRDDKNYPYIKVSLTEDFPRVYRVRAFKRDGNRYFGPYTNSGAVDSTLDLMNKVFPFRTCRYDASTWAPPRGTGGESTAGMEAQASGSAMHAILHSSLQRAVRRARQPRGVRRRDSPGRSLPRGQARRGAGRPQTRDGAGVGEPGVRARGGAA